jgi:hypothetical protein
MRRYLQLRTNHRSVRRCKRQRGLPTEVKEAIEDRGARTAKALAIAVKKRGTLRLSVISSFRQLKGKLLLSEQRVPLQALC